MKYAKILGLAAVAALALTALFGAGPASATVLCKETPSGSPPVCPSAQTYNAGQTILGEATDPLLTNDLETVTCKRSNATFEIKQTGSPTSTVIGTVTALTFTECETVITRTPCTVGVENLPYLAEVHWISGTHNGTFTGKGVGTSNPGAKVTCLGVLVCKFSTPEAVLAVNGGNPANLVANKVELEPNGGFLGAICPSEAFWDATYAATNPTNIWVAREES
jgi:hypothetical protein